MTKKAEERNELKETLRKWLKPGDTVYTILRHVSRSGMFRVIDLVKVGENGQIVSLGWSAAEAIGAKYDRGRDGIRTQGCGMDMGYHLVYNLSRVLFPEFRCIGKDCPSNDHTNYRKMIQCAGGENEQGEFVPCFVDTDGVYRLRTGVGEEFGLGAVCPTCRGKGRYFNPKKPIRKGQRHSDGGYALRQRWL